VIRIAQTSKFKIIENKTDECWDLIEVDGIKSDEGNEDAVVAKIYDPKTFMDFINMMRL